MARLPRLVIPGLPYHVTQRGNRRERTFFCDEDYAYYRALLGAAARKAGAEVWSYCLMPNHVHVIVVPSDPDGLRATFADAHRRYTGHINARHRWTGHLWQGRFGAVAMDEAHLAAAARYVALNPVRAHLAPSAEQWPWNYGDSLLNSPALAAIADGSPSASRDSRPSLPRHPTRQPPRARITRISANYGDSLLNSGEFRGHNTN